VSIQTNHTLHSDRRATLTLDGRLDAVSAQAVKAQLGELVQNGHAELIVCLEAVPFIDSSGLAALVAGLKQARQAGGTLKLAGLGEQARTVFRLTMLEQVFEIYADAGEALASFVGP
jgi:anti-sigma B factor antagonist